MFILTCIFNTFDRRRTPPHAAVRRRTTPSRGAARRRPPSHAAARRRTPPQTVEPSDRSVHRRTISGTEIPEKRMHRRCDSLALRTGEEFAKIIANPKLENFESLPRFEIACFFVQYFANTVHPNFADEQAGIVTIIVGSFTTHLRK